MNVRGFARTASYSASVAFTALVQLVSAHSQIHSPSAELISGDVHSRRGRPRALRDKRRMFWGHSWRPASATAKSRGPDSFL
jgi:hypothetical protein